MKKKIVVFYLSIVKRSLKKKLEKSILNNSQYIHFHYLFLFGILFFLLFSFFSFLIILTQGIFVIDFSSSINMLLLLCKMHDISNFFCFYQWMYACHCVNEVYKTDAFALVDLCVHSIYTSLHVSYSAFLCLTWC